MYEVYSDIAYFTEIYFNKELLWDTRLATLSEKFKCSTRTIERWATRLKITVATQEESQQYQIAQAKEYNKKVKIEKSKKLISSLAQKLLTNETKKEYDFAKISDFNKTFKPYKFTYD